MKKTRPDKTAIKLLLIAAIIACAAAALLFFTAKDELHFQRALGFQILPGGNILVTDGGGFKLRDAGSKIFIINRKGQVLWKYESVRFAHSALKLSNSNIIIPDTNNNRLLEISPEGKETWSSDSWGSGTGMLPDGRHLDYPNYVCELPEGRFLVSGRYNNAVWETDRAGKIYWSYKKLRLQHAPIRLASGNTLIADSEGNRIIEVNPAGKTVWSYSAGLNWPRFGQRLNNGNTLITDSNNNRIIEVTAKGETVFEYGKGVLSMPYQAEALENGNIMIADGQHGRLVEINRYKKIVWSFESKNSLKMWFSMPDRIKNGGCEETEPGGAPRYWTKCDLLAPDGGIWSVDSVHKAAGNAAFKIEAAFGAGRNKMWGQFLRNWGGKNVVLRCMIRTKDVKEGAGVSLNFVDAKAGLIGGVNSKIYRGSTEWTGLVIVSPVPKKTMAIGVLLSLVGPGTAWWDEVSLEKK